MKLYYRDRSCALACWIALEWAGASYQTEAVNPSSSVYKAINPLGMVPALEVEGADRAMTQADAILQFIAKSYPEADLGPESGALNEFEFNETLAFLTGDFHPAFWPFFVPSRFTTSKDEADLEAVKEAAYLRIDRVMTHLDALIGESGHVYQNKRTVVDAYAFVMARWSQLIPKTWREYPHLSAFMEVMQEDPAVQKVLVAAKQVK